MDSLLGQDDRSPGHRAQHSTWHTGAQSSLLQPSSRFLILPAGCLPLRAQCKGPRQVLSTAFLPSCTCSAGSLARGGAPHSASSLKHLTWLSLPWTHRSPAVSLMGKSSHSARSSGWPGGLSFPSPSKASDGRQRGQRTECPALSDPPVKSPHTRSHPPRGINQAFFSRQRKTNAT